MARRVGYAGVAMTDKTTIRPSAARPHAPAADPPAPASRTAPAPAVRDALDDGKHVAAAKRATGGGADHALLGPEAPTAAALPSGSVKRGLSSSSYAANADAAAIFQATKGGMTGLGTDEAAIHKALANKSAEDVRALRAAYADHYSGRSLDEDILGELSGKHRERAQAALAGKPAKAAAIGIEQAWGTFGTDKDAVFSALAGKNQREVLEIQREYRARNDTSLRDDVKSHLGGDDRVRADALLQSDQNGARAAQLHKALDGMGTNEALIDSVLSSAMPADRPGIEAAYQKQTGRPLRADLQRHLSGAELDLATAQLVGDDGAARAARVNLAVSGLGTSKKDIDRALEGATPVERARVAEVYRAKYGETLDAALEDDLSGKDLDDARTLVAKGKLSDAQHLDRAVRGAGTDDVALRAVLTNKSKDELAAMDAEYRARNGGASLASVVKSETSGRDRFDSEMLLRGNVDTSTSAGLHEAVQRAQESRDFERQGAATVFARALTGFGNTGNNLDSGSARLQQVMAQSAGADGQLTDAGAQRVRTLLDYQQADVAHYREAKDTAAEAAGTSAAIVAGIAVTVATAGAAAPVVIAAATAAGAVSKGVVGAAVRGELTEDASWRDVRTGAVDGLASAVTGLATKGIGGLVTKAMANGEGAAARVGVSLGGTTAAGAEAASARGVVGASVEKSLNGAGKGAVSGATSGVSGAALDPTTYDGSALAAAATITARALGGARAGVVSGLNPSAAVAGTAVAKLAPRIDNAAAAALSKAGVDVAKQNGLLSAAVKIAVDAPRSVLTGAAASTLAAMVTGNASGILEAAADGALAQAGESAKGAAVSTTEATVRQHLKRPRRT